MLNFTRNAMIDVMLLELNLGNCDVKETNVIAALRHIMSGAANKVASDVHASIIDDRTFQKQGKGGYQNRLLKVKTYTTSKVSVLAKKNLGISFPGRRVMFVIALV